MIVVLMVCYRCVIPLVWLRDSSSNRSRASLTSCIRSHFSRTAFASVPRGQDNDSASIDRFIEVKTYIGKKHFHWSSNEIDVAKLRRNLYHLCLVDYEKIDEPGYMPEYIQNPYENVFESSSWLREPDSYTFSPVDRNE